jgi:hypothetical protein
MKSSKRFVLSMAASLALVAPSYAADPRPAGGGGQSPAAIVAAETPPTVASPAPGVFAVQKRGAKGLHLVVTGHKFTSRGDIEKYLAYRAAELTREQKGSWFTFVEVRTKGDTLPVPKPNPAGLRYSFRLEYFRPIWRYKTSGTPAWKSWSPFSGASFIADGQAITDFEVSADIVTHKGQMDDSNPLAFEAGAVSDFLINQVSPPQ